MADEGASTSSSATDPRDLRVPPAEREHVAGLPNKALVRDLIEPVARAQRLAGATAARTRAELDAVIVGPPGIVMRIAPNGRGG